ncbi:MAG: methyltransferase [Bdellovibrionales bacterium]
MSENQFSAPKQVVVIDDSFSADRYVAMASQGVSFVWKGDFHNARQLLRAVQRRIRKPASGPAAGTPQEMAKEFYRHRQHQAHKAQLLSRLLILIEPDLSIQLPRAPDLRQSISEALRSPEGDFLISLRELQGFVGAHEWRKKGVPIAALEGKRIHAHYGVFSPVRGEYLDLVAKASLPSPTQTAFDIGTGTGVLAAILAHRGVPQVVATDLDDRALECAKSNLQNLGFEDQVRVEKTHLFPEGQADLVICNPPWLPAKPTSAIEHAVYDEDSRMLKSFLQGVSSHLSDHGEAWLIMSDLAEHLGLRGHEDLKNFISQSGLRVIEQLKTEPRHSKALDEDDFLHTARSKEITSLWRLQKL